MGSLERGDNLQIRFEVTDGNKDIPVSSRGIVPDLFREGQGVVPEGHVEPGGTFTADTVLAKHDENYMPREVVDTLKKQGHWQETAAPNAVPVKGSAKGAGSHRHDRRTRSLRACTGAGLGADPIVVARHRRAQRRCCAEEARRLDRAGAIC